MSSRKANDAWCKALDLIVRAIQAPDKNHCRELAMEQYDRYKRACAEANKNANGTPKSSAAVGNTQQERKSENESSSESKAPVAAISASALPTEVCCIRRIASNSFQMQLPYLISLFIFSIDKTVSNWKRCASYILLRRQDRDERWRLALFRRGVIQE